VITLARRIGLGLARVLLGVAVVAAIAWATLALWFDGPASRLLAGLMAVGFALGGLSVLALLRPFRRASSSCCWRLPRHRLVAAHPRGNGHGWYLGAARLSAATVDGNCSPSRTCATSTTARDRLHGALGHTPDLTAGRGGLFLSF
jgi:hypothetical protein